MATAGALEDQELMAEGKNLSLQRCASLKGLPSRRKQREDDREHVAEKLQRRLPKFNQLSQNGVFSRVRVSSSSVSLISKAFAPDSILARDRVGLLLFWFWIRMPAGFTLTRSRFHESRDPGLINKNLLATLN
jgi:hypothetical protein